MSSILVERHVIGGRSFVVETEFQPASYWEIFGGHEESRPPDEATFLKCVGVEYLVDFQKTERREFALAVEDALKFAQMMGYLPAQAMTYWRQESGKVISAGRRLKD